MALLGHIVELPINLRVEATYLIGQINNAANNLSEILYAMKDLYPNDLWYLIEEIKACANLTPN